nr:hypothetical protein [Tanacetum cinerariifolium]
MDLKWQVAMLSMRVKRFYKKTDRNLKFNGKEKVGFDKTKVECFNCHRRGHFTRDCRSARNSRNMSRDARNAGYRGRNNCKRPAKEDDENALVIQDGLGTYDWSYQAEEEANNFALMAFTSNPSSSLSLNSKVQSCSKQCVQSYEQLKNFFNEHREKIRKANLEIIGYQYGLESIEEQSRVLQPNEVIYEEKIGVLEYAIKDKNEEVTMTVFDNRSSVKENSLANDRFKKGEGYHAVPPPITGNYMPPKSDLSFAGLDDSIYKFKISETATGLTKDEIGAPETSTACVDKPKEDRSSAPLIQDWDTKSDNDSVFRPKYIPAKIDFVKTGETVKHVKPVKSVKPVKPVQTAKQTKKSKNFNRMVKKSGLPNNVRKGTGHKESRPVWNNVQRINQQNKFVPTTLFTRFKRIPVSAAKPKVAASTSAPKPVNTTGPKQSVHFSKSISTFHKSHLHIRRSFYNETTHSRRNSTERVNTAGSKAVSAVKGNGVTTVKTSAGCVWRPRVKDIDQISKDNQWICTRIDYVDPQGRLKHMTGNKTYLTDYQEIYDGGFVAFGSSRGKSTDKGNQTDKNAGPQDTNGNASTQDNVDAGKEVSDQHYIVLPLWSSISSTFKSSNDKAAHDKPKDDTGSKTVEEPVNKEDQAYRDELNRLMGQEKEASDATDALRKESEQGCINQRGATNAGSTNPVNTVSNPVNAASTSGTFSASGPSSPHPDTFIPANTLLHVDQDDSQIPNLEDTAELRSTGIFNSTYDDELDIFTSLVQSVGAEADFNNKDSSTVKVWRLVDLPYGKKAIRTKWMYMNKKDEMGIVIEAIRSFLAFASFMGFIVYQMDVKSAFLYGTIEEEVYVSQPPGFIDPEFSNKVYKVEKALYGLHQAPRAWFQVTPKLSHPHVVKRIFRYLKGQPKLDLWYPRDSPFDLEAYLDSDYARANLDRKSTIGEYVAAANCRGQVLWIQNQMLDYGFNFTNTKIYIDNESTICIVKNPVYH